MRKFLYLIIAMSMLVGCNRAPATQETSLNSQPVVDTSFVVEDEDSEEEEIIEDILPPEPKIKEAEDVATYFNDCSTYGIVEYLTDQDYTGWFLQYNFGEPENSFNTILTEAIAIFRDFLPLKAVVEDGYLMHFGDDFVVETPNNLAYCVSIDVSSNWFAAVSIFSYIENNELFAEVYIYNGRGGVYSELYW